MTDDGMAGNGGRELRGGELRVEGGRRDWKELEGGREGGGKEGRR